MTLGTCARCPAQAVRTLGMAALCGDCVERILAPIRARVADYDPDDRVYPAVMGAWVDRMAVAIEAGIITREEATRAYERGARRDHAA
jgi:hypothetical protein